MERDHVSGEGTPQVSTRTGMKVYRYVLAWRRETMKRDHVFGWMVCMALAGVLMVWGASEGVADEGTGACDMDPTPVQEGVWGSSAGRSHVDGSETNSEELGALARAFYYQPRSLARLLVDFAAEISPTNPFPNSDIVGPRDPWFEAP